jgi:hypothetical protein
MNKNVFCFACIRITKAKQHEQERRGKAVWSLKFPSSPGGYQTPTRIGHNEYSLTPPYSGHPEFPFRHNWDIGLNELSDHLPSHIVFPGSSTPVGHPSPKASRLYQQPAMRRNGEQHTPPAPFGSEGRPEPVCLF